jgi:hypothetical protein
VASAIESGLPGRECQCAHPGKRGFNGAADAGSTANGCVRDRRFANSSANANAITSAEKGEAWKNWLARLNRRNWRTRVFFEIVSAEISASSGARRPTVVDVSCGRGFEGEAGFQQAFYRAVKIVACGAVGDVAYYGALGAATPGAGHG